MFIPDPGCSSRIPDPGSWIQDPKTRILIFTHPGSQIPDLGSRIKKQQQKRGAKKNWLPYLFLQPQISQNFIFQMLKKKICASFQRIIKLFTQIFATNLLKYGFGIRDPRSGIRDLGSEIRDPRSGIRKKTYSESRGQKGTGSRIPGPRSATQLVWRWTLQRQKEYI
jgi:hypothetical protein